MITKAAIKSNGIIYTGRRHSVVYGKYPCFLTQPHEQGFITSENDFLDRHEAAKHAFKCGQLQDKTCPDIICSEDLW